MSRGAEQARSRILSDDELRTVWRACGDYPGFGPMLRFILLTATRRTEAAEMTWAELADGTWIIPAARYKTKHDHVVPLSPLAQSMLPERQNGELVWTRNGRTPMSNYDYHKQAIDRLSGATNWVIHDLRRTARSLLSRAGVATDHAERCLGHVIGGVRGVYDRHEYFEEKARAFEALAAQVERIIHPPAEGKVVAMRPKR
jgi:integrase